MALWLYQALSMPSKGLARPRVLLARVPSEHRSTAESTQHAQVTAADSFGSLCRFISDNLVRRALVQCESHAADGYRRSHHTAHPVPMAVDRWAVHPLLHPHRLAAGFLHRLLRARVRWRCLCQL